VQWYERSRIGLAIQINTSADDAIPGRPGQALDDAVIALEALR